MKELNYTIQSEHGFHARPAGMFVKECAKFPCTITVTKGEKEVDASKLIALMGLGAKQGEEIVLRCDGEQEDEAIAVLEAFLKENL